MHVYLFTDAAMCWVQSVNCVRYNADATVLLSGSYDKTIRAWDLRYECMQAFTQGIRTYV